MSRLFAMALALVASAVASGESAPPIRTDADGVPLPDGAIARLGSARFRFAGHPWGTVAFAPDGKRLAVGDSVGVSVFDTATGRQLLRLSIPDKHYPQVVRFLADGKRLAVGLSDYRQSARLNIHNLADGKVASTSTFAGQQQIFVSDVTPDGSRVLVVDWFVKAYLWDLQTEREVWSFKHQEAAFVKPFTADGKYLATSGSRRADLYDAQTGQPVGPFADPGPRFRDRYQAGMSPDGRLAVGSEKGDVVAVLAARGENRVRLLPSDRRTERFVFSADSRYLASPMPGGTQVWDLTAPDDKGPVARLPGALAAGFAADGKTLALADEGSIVLYTVGEWKPLPQSADPPSPVLRALFLPDGKVIGYTRKGWITWPAAGGTGTRLSDDSPVHVEAYADVSADGRTAVDVLHESGRGDGQGKFTLRLTDLAAGKDRRFPVDGYIWGSARISPDGRFVSAFAKGSNFTIWDAKTGAVLHERRSPDRGTCFGALATADGKGVACSAVGIFNQGGGFPGEGPAYSSITVTDHRTGREWKMEPMPWTVYSGGARFSRDGSRMVLMGHFDNNWERDSVTVWDVAAGRRLMKWDQESGRLDSVALSPDHRSLLAGDRKGRLAVIDIATGEERASFQHRGQILSSAFHPDGTKALSSSPDAPAYVWDLHGHPGRWDPAKANALWADLLSSDAKTAFAAIRTLRANPTEAVAFLKEQVKLAAAPTDEQFKRWLTDLDAPRFVAREQAQRDLTAAADLIRPKLNAARTTASEEAGRRLAQILTAADGLTPDKLRHIRACEVLEGIGTPAALNVLKSWANGPVGARLTTEAAESLIRKAP